MLSAKSYRSARVMFGVQLSQRDVGAERPPKRGTTSSASMAPAAAATAMATTGCRRMVRRSSDAPASAVSTAVSRAARVRFSAIDGDFLGELGDLVAQLGKRRLGAVLHDRAAELMSFTGLTISLVSSELSGLALTQAPTTGAICARFERFE